MRGLLLYGDTVRSPALRHEIPIAIIDAVLFAEVDGKIVYERLGKTRRRVRIVPTPPAG
jgi:cellobiose-specific phosphotransferase system component IIB